MRRRPKGSGKLAHEDVDEILAVGRAQALGSRHRGYGVRAGHYVLMGNALLEALAAARGAEWTPEAAEAWAAAYDLVAETMQQGALLRSPPATE